VGGLSQGFKMEILAIMSKDGLRRQCAGGLRRWSLDGGNAIENVGLVRVQTRVSTPNADMGAVGKAGREWVQLALILS
jgi:hypothetical protein